VSVSIRRALVVAAQAVIVLLMVGYGGLRYLTIGPDSSFATAQRPLTSDEMKLQARLGEHLATIASGERNMAHFEGLERVAAHIETTLEQIGYTVGRQNYTVNGRQVRNIEAVIEPVNRDPSPEVIVVGAYYDAAVGTPGADANATGTAAVLELTRQLIYQRGITRRRIRFVFFVNKEAPYFQTADMGSWRYAQALAARGERVKAMYSLDSLGYYSGERGTQRHAPLLDWVLPDRGDFVAFVGSFESRRLARDALNSFRLYSKFPSFAAAGPSFIPGVAESDDWAFAQQGFPAIAITDTGPLRYPHYHKETDTPDKIDLERLTRVVRGIEGVIREAAEAPAHEVTRPAGR
jgi:peptidase M28-like protein